MVNANVYTTPVPQGSAGAYRVIVPDDLTAQQLRVLRRLVREEFG